MQQKILSNRTLPIIITLIDLRIDDRFAICGPSLYKLATPQTTEVIMYTERSSAWVLQTPRRVSWTGRDSNTPGHCGISARPPRANFLVLSGCLGFSPASGHSGILYVFNKRQSTVPDQIRDTQTFDTSVDRNLADDGDYMSTFSKVIGCELSHSSSADL